MIFCKTPKNFIKQALEYNSFLKVNNFRIRKIKILKQINTATTKSCGGKF